MSSSQGPDGVSGMRVGELIDASIKLTTRNARELVLAVLLVVVVGQVINVVVALATRDELSGLTFSDSGALQGKTNGTVVLVGLIVVVVGVLTLVLGQLACFRILIEAHLGRSASVGDSLRWAAPRLGPALVIGVLYTLAILAGLVLFILPGIYLAVAFSLALPVLLVEQEGAAESLGRSRRLVRGYWWPTLGRFVVAGLVVVVVQLVVTSVLGGIFGALTDDGSSAALVLAGVSGAVAQLLTTPFLAAVTTLVYFDLRARKEGFDAHAADARDREGAGRDRGTDAFGRPVADDAPRPAPAWEPAPPARAPEAPRTPPAPPPGWAPPSPGR